MDKVERTLLQATEALSRALDPLAGWIGRLHFFVRTQLSNSRIPADWQGGIITALWVLVLFMLFRILAGWLRIVMLACTAMVVAKVYGVLPQ